MPQLPVLIPIIVTGLLVGSVMINAGRRISMKRLGIASLLSGLLNGAQAYLVNYLTPSTFRTGTATFPSAGTFAGLAAVRQTSELTYTVSSILAGILIPLAILGIAMLRSRSKSSDEEVEPEESISEK